MKHIIRLLLPVLLTGCYSKEPVKTGLEGKPMPELSMLLIESMSYFNTNMISKGTPTVLFSFEPWCIYCRAQTTEIVTHIKELKNIQFYMITTASFPEFKKFYDHYQLNRYPNITAGREDSSRFEKYFKTSAIPFLAIYDKDKKLKQALVGRSGYRLIKNIALK